MDYKEKEQKEFEEAMKTKSPVERSWYSIRGMLCSFIDRHSWKYSWHLKMRNGYIDWDNMHNVKVYQLRALDEVAEASNVLKHAATILQMALFKKTQMLADLRDILLASEKTCWCDSVNDDDHTDLCWWLNELLAMYELEETNV